jgi:hypothetical protein
VKQPQIGDKVTIDSPGHRQDGRTGTVSAGPGKFMGTYTVPFDGHDYGFLPGELKPAE